MKDWYLFGAMMALINHNTEQRCSFFLGLIVISEHNVVPTNSEGPGKIGNIAGLAVLFYIPP